MLSPTLAGDEPLRHAAPGDEAAGNKAPPSEAPAHRFWHILVRDDFTCQLCGTRRNLQVHHVQRRSQGGKDAAKNLLTLCAACHEMVHRGETVLGPTG